MFASSAASCAPSAIVWPTYGVRENGALTATSRVFVERSEPPSSPQAGRKAQRAKERRVSRFKGLGMLERLAAQVRGSHRFVGGDLRQGACRDPAPGLEDGDEVGDAPHEAEVVLDHEQGETPVAK